MRVLISGYYGFGNAGDEALLDGLLAGLRSAGHRPLVLSADPEATRTLHGVAATHRLRGLVPALLRCQALVSGGGGLLQDRTSARSLHYYLALVRAARLLGKRAVVYGQSLGPLSTGGREAVASTLRGVPIAVRDPASRELLAELGLPATLTADPALLLEPPTGAGHVRDGVLLIPRGGHSALTDDLAAVGARLLQRGCDVELLALHPAADDGELRRLAAELPGATIRIAADHRQALAFVAHARLVVSVRLHGLILAAAGATPFVGLAYDPKVAAFVADSQGTGFSPPIDRAKLFQAVEAGRGIDDEARARLRARAECGLEWLDNTLRGMR
ncbi:MAG: polysaccharide pyruvyl transferase CsaB [Trueperaceae bacterium]